jgi:hypothetical protein
MTVAVVLICLALVLAGLAAVARWGALPVQPPPSGSAARAPDPAGTAAGADPGAAPDAGGLRPLGLVLRRYLWYVDLAVIAGTAATVMATGAGGRLAMRLLAVTAGAGAQGRITEAGETVGEITAGGTIGFALFLSLFGGFAVGAGYLLLRRWLPAGRLGGGAYGLLLLLVLGSRVDPLRAGNPDFDIVGPSWLAVVVLAAVVLFEGMLIVALTARLSRALPLITARPGAAAAYLPLVLLVPFAPLVVVAAVGALVAVGASRVRPLVAAWRDGRVDLAGRLAVLAGGLVAAPGFVVAVADILGRA